MEIGHVVLLWITLCVFAVDTRQVPRSTGMRREARNHKNSAVSTGKHREKSRKTQSSGNSREGSATCCGDRGLCVLNSFCLCFKHYHGRRCEYFSRGRSCGGLRDGAVRKVKCSVCYCGDGVLTCFPRVTECDQLTEGADNTISRHIFGDENSDDAPSFLTSINNGHALKPSPHMALWTLLMCLLLRR